jgi:hypothetical protein
MLLFYAPFANASRFQHDVVDDGNVLFFHLSSYVVSKTAVTVGYLIVHFEVGAIGSWSTSSLASNSGATRSGKLSMISRVQC